MVISRWNEQNIEKLKELWKQGLTARQISDELKGGITRNAVIGKAHRLGLSVPRPRVEPLAPPNLIADNPGEQCCQWPQGHPREHGFHFCGAPILPGHPYCAKHCSIAYRSMMNESQ